MSLLVDMVVIVKISCFGTLPPGICPSTTTKLRVRIQKIMGSEDQMYVELKMIKNYDPKQN